MKIKITEKEDVKEVEISLGLSSKSKGALKAFAERTINTVVNTGAKAVKKVDEFIDKVTEEETRDFREHLNEIVEQAKEDANRMAENAINAFMKKEKEKPSAFSKYLNKFIDYKCSSDNPNEIEEARKFMKSINYPITPTSIKAFEKSLYLVETLSYESIAESICTVEIDVQDIIETLQVEFKIWLNKNPDIKENFPDASLMDLLKCFKTKFYKEEEIFEDEPNDEELFDEKSAKNTSCESEEDDDYPDEIEEKETLEQKIAKIPEGKTFTLAEYLDYTEEYTYDKFYDDSYLIAKEFLDKIDFPHNSKTTSAFAIILTLDKPSYKKISRETSGFENEAIIEDLKKNFELWLNERTDIKKYCPQANLWQLMIYFKKKVYESINE